MKKIWLKSICLTSSLSVLPLFSCGQNIKQSDITTNIEAPFFANLQDICFNNQLKQDGLWKQIVQVFRDHEDTDENAGANWRGEFWGKMMRGGVLCYKYSHDENLYKELKTSVEDILEAQTEDVDGRISTYHPTKEFKDWDMWGRKYVMTGLLHFYDICKEEEFKEQIIEGLKKHADYILKYIGPGKIDITHTGFDQWRGLNSCTILEPMVNLYEVTHEKRYLDFATYIINTGGSFDGNMIDAAKANLNPIDFPVRKAYESMSFFEGVYRYGKVVWDKSLIKAALNYFNKIAKEEITVIGSGGYEEEQWHAGNVSQTTSHTGQGWPLRWGNETCVTVTWMRILNILYEETHDIKYYEQFETSALNAFLGALNVDNQKIRWYNPYKKEDTFVANFPFDTYSPICCEPRGIDAGGVVKFLKPATGFETYGCCQCNAPASVGLMGMNACRAFGNKWYLNEYYKGVYSSDRTILKIDGDYDTKGNADITIQSKSDEKLILRIPSWSNEPTITINGEKKTVAPGKYFEAGTLKNIKTIAVSFNPKPVLHRIHDKVYFTYGPHVLAFDQYHNTFLQGDDIVPMRDIQIRDLDTNNLTKETAESDEIVRFSINYKDGSKKIILTNYSSAGRHAYIYENPTTCMVNIFFKCDFPKEN